MTTDMLVKQLNKEMKTLRRDVSEMKAVLIRALAIPEERLSDYQNSSAIKKAFQKAQKTYSRK